MSLTLHIPGGAVQLSGNRIQAEVETDTTTGTLYNLLLKTTSLDDSFPEGIDAIEPDKNNKAVFDIRNRVSLPIVYSFTWPLTGAVAVEQPQMAKKVAIDIGERYVVVVNDENKDPVNWAGLSGAACQVLILKGGISKHAQAKYNEQNTTFYIEWIQAGKFLTMLPDGITVSPGQPVKLWFITKESSVQSLTIHASFVGTDGTGGALSREITIKPGTMTELCVDMASLGMDATAVSSYSVWLEKSGTVVSEIRSFEVDQGYYQDNTYLLYVNEVGGIDCIWLHGRVKKMFPTESETSKRDARVSDTQPRPTREVDYKTGRRKWTVNTGYMPAENMAALTGLFESRNVWILEGNDIIPVMIADDDNEYYNSTKDTHQMDITFEEAH